MGILAPHPMGLTPLPLPHHAPPSATTSSLFPRHSWTAPTSSLLHYYTTSHRHSSGHAHHDTISAGHQLVHGHRGNFTHDLLLRISTQGQKFCGAIVPATSTRCNLVSAHARSMHPPSLHFPLNFGIVG